MQILRVSAVPVLKGGFKGGMILSSENAVRADNVGATVENLCKFRAKICVLLEVSVDVLFVASFATFLTH